MYAWPRSTGKGSLWINTPPFHSQATGHFKIYFIRLFRRSHGIKDQSPVAIENSVIHTCICFYSFPISFIHSSLLASRMTFQICGVVIYCTWECCSNSLIQWFRRLLAFSGAQSKNSLGSSASSCAFREMWPSKYNDVDISGVLGCYVESLVNPKRWVAYRPWLLEVEVNIKILLLFNTFSILCFLLCL